MRYQLTHIQIDNYGPWTVTPEPRREVDLQALQSRLYADLAQLFGTRDGYVFASRFDNMIAVSNGTDGNDHALVRESVTNRYPVTISMAFDTESTPVAALAAATNRLQNAGSAQDRHREEILEGDPLADESRSDEDVQLAHFDVNDATGKYTDRFNEFDTLVRIQRGYLELAEYMRETHDSLCFFVGGDNVIAICPRLNADAYEEAVSHVRETVALNLKVGVGRGRTAAEAGMDAKYALEECRATGTDVETAF